jgi:hypothetical protein
VAGPGAERCEVGGGKRGLRQDERVPAGGDELLLTGLWICAPLHTPMLAGLFGTPRVPSMLLPRGAWHTVRVS